MDLLSERGADHIKVLAAAAVLLSPMKSKRLKITA